ncbi:hypothetical protein A11A3_12028 [Alcanivorax hongdengensis A-11-3]|uniref:Iron-binding zinc finger CDGSH type domain-containing protein n=1 Tax=Alcanivorax hongdengensis A-11-3 TaxID=1177179 RepID=L0WA09_9GAMM|nr:CDGSH iron-sulfur domain-containing protein [Alcanivorax hongdengensis]EKF73806.1 hypothetical protein A11A3_12028 [Alcanivorax hongdengensis A-11-3]
MATPKTPATVPFPMELKKGETRYWCACGRSASQPFCDGSHKGTGFTPLAYTADRDRIVFFCGCKHSGSAPVCDGSHVKIMGRN